MNQGYFYWKFERSTSEFGKRSEKKKIIEEKVKVILLKNAVNGPEHTGMDRNAPEWASKLICLCN